MRFRDTNRTPEQVNLIVTCIKLVQPLEPPKFYDMTMHGYERGIHLPDEDSTKKKKNKKDKKKKNNALHGVSTGIISQYNNMETKSNVNNSLIKSLVDVAAAGLIGPALSAALGKYSPLAAIGLSFGGHYTGEQSGLMRGIGMSTMAHAVAKSKDYREPDSTLQNRLSELKDDWLSMILLGKTEEKKSIFDGIEQPVKIEPVGEISEISDESESLSSIDYDLAEFEQKTNSFLEDQAQEFESEMEMEEQLHGESEEDDSEGFDSLPFEWDMKNSDLSERLIQANGSTKESDFPDDFDFSEL